MKIRIGTDERWPDYFVTDDGFGWEADVPLETLERWKKIEDEYGTMQAEMAALVADAKARSKPKALAGGDQ